MRLRAPGGGGGGRRGTLIFSYIHRRVSFIWFTIKNFDIFFGFQKKKKMGMKILWIFIGVITKLDYI